MDKKNVLWLVIFCIFNDAVSQYYRRLQVACVLYGLFDQQNRNKKIGLYLLRQQRSTWKKKTNFVKSENTEFKFVNGSSNQPIQASVSQSSTQGWRTIANLCLRQALNESIVTTITGLWAEEVACRPVVLAELFTVVHNWRLNVVVSPEYKSIEAPYIEALNAEELALHEELDAYRQEFKQLIWQEWMQDLSICEIDNRKKIESHEGRQVFSFKVKFLNEQCDLLRRKQICQTPGPESI